MPSSRALLPPRALKRQRPAAADPRLAEDLSRRGLRATRQRLALLRLLRAAAGGRTED